MNTPNEDQDIILNSAYNPFPEPQTIPSGWDLTALTSTSEVESSSDETEAAEE